MRRLAIVLSLLVVLGFGVRALVHALASDATKIRWLVEDMLDGFNATRMNPILAALDKDFVDDGSGADKDVVRAVLAQVFLERKDPQTKAFPWRVTLASAAQRITVTSVSGAPKSAVDELEALFEESHGAEWSPAWRIRVRAELAEGDDGWKIRRTRVDTLDGRRMR